MIYIIIINLKSIYLSFNNNYFYCIYFIKSANDKKNVLIAEKYIQAGIYLNSNKNNEAKNILEEIVLSENKFYSILALNSIIEKTLIEDKNKILNYFKILENANLGKNKKETYDLIVLKKALYLQKISDIKSADELLKILIEKTLILKILLKNCSQNNLMKIFHILAIILLFYNCSFDNKTGIWKNEVSILEDNKNLFKEFNKISYTKKLS